MAKESERGVPTGGDAVYAVMRCCGARWCGSRFGMGTGIRRLSEVGEGGAPMGGWAEADGAGVYTCEDLFSFFLHILYNTRFI